MNKPRLLENIVTNEQFVCPDPRDLHVIEGVEYIPVQRPGYPRIMLMRKDALRPVKSQVHAR